MHQTQNLRQWMRWKIRRTVVLLFSFSLFLRVHHLAALALIISMAFVFFAHIIIIIMAFGQFMCGRGKYYSMETATERPEHSYKMRVLCIMPFYTFHYMFVWYYTYECACMCGARRGTRNDDPEMKRKTHRMKDEIIMELSPLFIIMCTHVSYYIYISLFAFSFEFNSFGPPFSISMLRVLHTRWWRCP